VGFLSHHLDTWGGSGWGPFPGGTGILPVDTPHSPITLIINLFGRRPSNSA
jgi:hypothetical protein